MGIWYTQLNNLIHEIKEIFFRLIMSKKNIYRSAYGTVIFTVLKI